MNKFDLSKPWVRSGIMIFPAILLLGLLLTAVSGGRVPMMIWLYLPGIAFEQLFETWAYGLSNSQFANYLFAGLFWFTIGAGTGWLGSKVK